MRNLPTLTVHTSSAQSVFLSFFLLPLPTSNQSLSLLCRALLLLLQSCSPCRDLRGLVRPTAEQSRRLYVRTPAAAARYLAGPTDELNSSPLLILIEHEKCGLLCTAGCNDLLHVGPQLQESAMNFPVPKGRPWQDFPSPPKISDSRLKFVLVQVVIYLIALEWRRRRRRYHIVSELGTIRRRCCRCRACGQTKSRD